MKARLGCALLLGTLLGLERQWRQRLAGTRTNAFVCIAAAAFGHVRVSGGRHPRSEAQVSLLNTAVTIWCSADVSATCGLGFVAYGVTVAAAVLLTNTVATSVLPASPGAAQ